ncbi:MAG: serine/threonine-protein kinase [Myxococcota bacterium]
MPSPSQLPAKGDEIGRYVVLRKLGAGGMGVVYLAYDPELDRRVALKLLRGHTSAKNRRALLREAQAMAKLTHPNVVAVHDAGEHDGTVYVAMEFIEGTTLTEWLRAGSRSWREVLEVFLGAGQGLRAAHEHELIHRDFKPDNVMVSFDGQVRVMDFGLARPSQDASSENVEAEVESLRSSLLDEATVDRFAGTPAYMAPEQVMPNELTPAADQFSFCVSLWEGICRQRPFDGATTAETFANAAEGKIHPPPKSARMPRWLRRALQRGLDAKPRARWASMARLLVVLERGRRRWRWQAGLCTAVTVAGVASLVVVQQRHRAHAQQAECEARGDRIDEVWNDDERERVRKGLLATGARFAPDNADKVIQRLDAYRDQWSAARTEACVHASIEPDWSRDRRDRAQWCLDDRRLQLEVTVDQIATLRDKGARRAVRIASYLDPVSTCLEAASLRNLPVPPLDQRAEIRSIRMEISESDGLSYAGRYDEGLELGERAMARARALGWPPLLAQAQFIVGRRLVMTGRFRAAELMLTDAYFKAMDAGSIEVAFRSAHSLIQALTPLHRYREAELWARHATRLSASLSDPSGLDRAEKHYLLLHVYLGLGDYAEAARQGERSVELRTEALGAEHPITAAAVRNLGRVYLAQGRPREALALFVGAHDVWLDAVGPEHPYIGELDEQRGRALFELGHVEEALALQEQGLALYERVVRPDHIRISRTLEGMFRTQLALGRIEAAQRSQARAARIRLDSSGQRNRAVAQGLLELADIDMHRGELDRALQRCDEALAGLEGFLEPEHPDVLRAMERKADILHAMGRLDDAVQWRRQALGRRHASPIDNDRQRIRSLDELGVLLLERSDVERAGEAHREALALAERVIGLQDEALIPSLAGLTEVALARGNPGRAVSLAQRAVSIAKAREVGPRHWSRAHFALAQALDATGESERSLALAKRAVHEHRLAYEHAHRAEVERWLAQREGASVSGAGQAQGEPGSDEGQAPHQPEGGEVGPGL